jgi:predicted PurR-regulated permease PerM
MSSMEKRSIIQSSSITLLAIAIAYLAYGLISIASVVPEVINFLNKNNYQLSPVIKEVSEIRNIIPGILAEIQDIKKLVPVMTLEMAKISDQIPQALKTVNSIAPILSNTTIEITELRKTTIPHILQESKKIRASMPTYINGTQKIVKDVQTAINEASRISENVGTGVISGLVKSPFKLFSSMVSSVSGLFEDDKLSGKDLSIMTEAGAVVIESKELNFSKEWENKESKRFGEIKLVSIDLVSKCNRLEIIIHTKDKQSSMYNYKFCRDVNNQWFYVKET